MLHLSCDMWTCHSLKKRNQTRANLEATVKCWWNTPWWDYLNISFWSPAQTWAESSSIWLLKSYWCCGAHFCRRLDLVGRGVYGFSATRTWGDFYIQMCDSDGDRIWDFMGLNNQLNWVFSVDCWSCRNRGALRNHFGPVWWNRHRLINSYIPIEAADGFHGYALRMASCWQMLICALAICGFVPLIKHYIPCN